MNRAALGGVLPRLPWMDQGGSSSRDKVIMRPEELTPSTWDSGWRKSFTRSIRARRKRKKALVEAKQTWRQQMNEPEQDLMPDRSDNHRQQQWPPAGASRTVLSGSAPSEQNIRTKFSGMKDKTTKANMNAHILRTDAVCSPEDSSTASSRKDRSISSGDSEPSCDKRSRSKYANTSYFKTRYFNDKYFNMVNDDESHNAAEQPTAHLSQSIEHLSSPHPIQSSESSAVQNAKLSFSDRTATLTHQDFPASDGVIPHIPKRKRTKKLRIGRPSLPQPANRNEASQGLPHSAARPDGGLPTDTSKATSVSRHALPFSNAPPAGGSRQITGVPKKDHYQSIAPVSVNADAVMSKHFKQWNGSGRDSKDEGSEIFSAACPLSTNNDAEAKGQTSTKLFGVRLQMPL